MLQIIRRTRRGFTLVEIMIVVAIIALLAAIAIPSFLRARKRSQATVIINDARMIDGAYDQYAIEFVKPSGSNATSAAIAGYLKPGSRLYNQAHANVTLTDVLGNPYTYGSIDLGVHVSTGTTASFNDVIENASSFWGAYMQ